MQTFMPRPDPYLSAMSLDNKRLGKQRVEVLQILKALTVPGAGWANHPATKMWRGHVDALVTYGLVVCDVWTARGFKDTCWEKTLAYAQEPTYLHATAWPVWVGDEEFHQAHQSNLIRKDPAHYGPQFPGVPDDLPYIWPEP